MNVADWIKKWSLLLPGKVALIDNDTSVTYRELNQRINKLSNYLLSTGVKEGERVAVLLDNCRQFIELFFAVSKIGAIFVPLNYRLVGREIEYIMGDCSAQTLFFGENFAEKVDELKGNLSIERNRFVCVGKEAPSWARIYEKELEWSASTEPALPQGVTAEVPHIIMYTSGTTGLPKGAILSHRKTCFNILNANIYYHVTPNDKIIVSRPLFHSGGLLVDTLPFLYKGATAIIRRRFSPEELLHAIQEHSVTVMETSATMFRFILEQCNLDRYDLSTVKCFFTGGERVPPSLLMSYMERGIVISQIFGQTETSTITWLPVEHAERKIGSVGIPVFHGEVAIVDEEGNELPAGESGEIIVSGPILMSGYWGKPELTAETIRDGWLHTGDIGTRDEEGFFYILDRARNMFVSGGENVYPAEIEAVLIENPKIQEAAVVGVRDGTWGEVGKAFIVVKEGEVMSPEEVLQWCADRLAGYKIPKHIQFAPQLPENAAGKIMRDKLSDLSAPENPLE